jgi:DNA polymerase-3 subunit delta'
VPWHSIRGHDRVVDQLKSSLRNERLPHALFFVGPEGIGKRTIARKLAQSLLCEVRSATELDPCEKCPGCLQVAGATHPDFLEAAKPEDKHELPISVIRELCDWFGLKPSRGGYKIAILDDADDLNDEASNAFLKTLEEPPPGAVLILIGSSAELQLETIISRCQVIRFDPLDDSDIAALLLEQRVVTDQASAERLAALGEGSFSRALGLADAALGEFRRSLIDDIAAPHGFDPQDLARKIQANINQAGKESVDKRRRASLLVGELARFFRRVLWETSGLAPPYPDDADRQAAEAVARRVEPEDVLVLADRCLQADFHVHRRLYMPLIIETLTHDLAKLLNSRA